MSNLGSRARGAVPSMQEARRAAGAAPEEAESADSVGPTHKFALGYLDRTGKLWSGEFSCHIPTVREQIMIGRTTAALRGGVSPDQLDGQTFMITAMLGELAIVLDTVPPWATGNGLQELLDPQVIGEIYKEVRAHAARFWGPDPEAAGEGDGDEREHV